jgi:hypothetical protein
MLVMRAGQALRIRNSDDTLHNIHPRPQVNSEFNIGQPRKDMESVREGEKGFAKPEVMIPVGCDVHPWMRAYISVLEHPFSAVTKEDGTFEIKGLPAGDYEVEAFHGKLKTQTQKITPAGAAATSPSWADRRRGALAVHSSRGGRVEETRPPGRLSS